MSPATGSAAGTTITGIPGAKSAMTDSVVVPRRARAVPQGRSRIRWRPWLRALHRDAGYFFVGLTFVYAVSGLAVNHIADWEPNFRQVTRQHQLPAPLPGEDEQIAGLAARALELTTPVREAYRTDERTLQVEFDRRTL